MEPQCSHRQSRKLGYRLQQAQQRQQLNSYVLASRIHNGADGRLEHDGQQHGELGHGQHGVLLEHGERLGHGGQQENGEQLGHDEQLEHGGLLESSKQRGYVLQGVHLQKL